MTQFYSRNDTTFNGDVYSIPFSYIKENEINVFINDELYNEWEFLNESQIKLTQTPTNLPDNSIVSIRRITDITEKIVNYKNNTILSKVPLNLAQDQLLNAIQEIYDDNTTFKTNINTTIVEVTEAANKINQLEESVNRATEASTKAQEAVLLANTKMEQTTQKIEELENKTEQIEANSEQIAAINQAILTKATTSLDNLADSGKAKFDGKWTITNNIIVFEGRVLSTSSTLVPFTLDFLPDNGEYEILFYSGVQLLYNNTYCYGSIGISSDIINTPFSCIRISGSASTGHVYIKDSLILPVKNKKVYISGDTQNINSKGDLIAIDYRKLGVGFETTNESEVTQDE